MVIGNLIIGDTYIEPQGSIEVINHNTGERCDLEFKQRGWTSQNKESILGLIKNQNGQAVYKIQGKYSDSFDVVNLETQLSWQIWKAP